MLALVIPQIETSVAFVFNLRLHIVPDVAKIICEKNWVSEGLKKSKIFLGYCPSRSCSCSGHWFRQHAAYAKNAVS